MAKIEEALMVNGTTENHNAETPADVSVNYMNALRSIKYDELRNKQYAEMNNEWTAEEQEKNRRQRNWTMIEISILTKAINLIKKYQEDGVESGIGDLDANEKVGRKWNDD